MLPDCILFGRRERAGKIVLPDYEGRGGGGRVEGGGEGEEVRRKR